jgi:NADH-quinone oxidoreductase subunit N
MLFYLFIYTLATFGAFAVVVMLTRDGETGVMIDELSGLWSTRPWVAVCMGVIMLALLGFPIFGGAGFFAKWYVLQAALQSPVPQTTLAVVLALTTALSAGYYLHVVMLMFMRPRPENAPRIERSGGMTQVVLGVSVALILILGFVPDSVVRMARGGRPKMEIEGSITQLPTRSATPPDDSTRQVADLRAAERSR